MVNLQIYKQWKIIGKNGKVRWSRRKKARSFVIGFGNFLEAIMGHSYSSNSAIVNIVDTGGNSTSIIADTQATNKNGGVNAAAGVTTYGMLVGTGTTAPATNDDSMETLTAHGSGANQLNYSAGTNGSTRIESTSVKILFQRSFSNASGGTITVRESGMVGSFINSTQKNLLFIHEAENQAIANGESGTLYYDFVMTT